MVPRPYKGPWGKIVVTRLKYPQKNRVSAYIGETRPPLPGRAFRARNGKSGRGQRRGKSNGISAPDQMEESDVFSDAVNGVPATAFVKLAGRAVDRRWCLAALFGGAAAVCTAHDELRRQRRRRHNPVLYTILSFDWKGRFGQAPADGKREISRLIPARP